MAKKIEISKEEIKDSYLNQKLLTYQIAKTYLCDPSIIQKRLKDLKNAENNIIERNKK